jgi:hypothetical protein
VNVETMTDVCGGKYYRYLQVKSDGPSANSMYRYKLPKFKTPKFVQSVYFFLWSNCHKTTVIFLKQLVM